MAENYVEITIVVERVYEYDGDQYRGIIKSSETTNDLWQSDWCDSPIVAFRKATEILAKIPTDFLYASRNGLQIKGD